MKIILIRLFYFLFFLALTCFSVLVCYKALPTCVVEYCLSPYKSTQHFYCVHLSGLNNTVDFEVDSETALLICEFEIFKKHIETYSDFSEIKSVKNKSEKFTMTMNANNAFILKAVQGNFHQGDQKIFGASGGKQCSCMALFSICWTTIRKVSIWKDTDLDYILYNGDQVFRTVNIDRALYAEELPLEIAVEDSEFNLEIIAIEDNFPSIFTSNDPFLNSTLFFNDTVTGAILFINDVCVSILKGTLISRRSVYIFDSHSRDMEGKISEGGKSVLLCFSLLESIKHYIFSVYGAKPFKLVYFSASVKGDLNHHKKKLGKMFYTKMKNKKYNEKNREKLKEMKKMAYEKNSDQINETYRTAYRKNSEKINKIRRNAYEQNSDRINEAKRKAYVKNSEKIKKIQRNAYEKNSDHINERKRKAYLKDSEKINKMKRKTYEKNCDQINETKRKVYAKNSDKINKMKRKAYENNSDQINETKRKVYAKNSDKINKMKRKAYENNSDQINETKRKAYLKNSKKLNKIKREAHEKNSVKINTKRKNLYRKKKNEVTTANERVKKFKDAINEGPYYICVSCHRTLYKRSVVYFKEDNYIKNGFFPDIYLVPSFDGMYYICNTCHKRLSKCEIPCQSVSNGLKIYDLPEQFQNLNKIERAVVSQRLLFSKIKIMPKGQFPKIKGIVCNVPIETEEVCNVLPRSLDESNVIFMKLKRKLCYKSNFISQTVRPDIVFTLLEYLKNNNHLYNNISIKELISEKDFQVKFINDNDSDIDFIISNNDISDEIEPPLLFINEEKVEKIITCSEIDNEFENEDPMSEHRLSCIETTLISKCPHVIADDEHITIAPGQGKAPLSILKDENTEMLAFPDLFPTGKFGYTHSREVHLTHTKYFNQRLLNYSQKFSSDSDYIFFANFISQQINLRNQINIAMRKVSGNNVTAGMLSNNFKETVQNFVVNDEAYRFMSSIKGSPAYWKNMLSDVMAMVKQLGIPSYFLTLSCADLRWDELVIIIYKLKGIAISHNEIQNMSYFDRCELLNSNPVLLARHFQFRVENFFKEIILKGSLGKILYYVIRVEFQTRGSPHVHCLIWAENMPILNSENSDEFVRFVDSKISANFPTQDSKINDLVQKYQVHYHSKTCKKYDFKECRFGYGRFFSHRTIIAKPLPEDIPNDEKIELIRRQKDILDKVKSYINVHLNPKKVNFFNPEKPNFKQNPSINEVLQLLNISLQDYENALAISTDNSDFQIHLKRDTNSCFVNNYFEEGLLAWEANIDLQPVFNHYKAIYYMCAYFSKNENDCSRAMKEALRLCKDLDEGRFITMRNLAKAYSDNRECSVQEAVYQLMPELWLRKSYPQVSFVSTGLPAERFHMFKNEQELGDLPEDSQEVYKKNMLDRYVDRPNRTFANGKFQIIDSLCYAQFCANYQLDTKIEHSNLVNDNQPDILNDAVIEENHIDNRLPKNIPLMSSKECLRCRKVKKVLRYFKPNRNLYPEKYAHHLLMLFFPFRNEEQDLKFNDSYMEKLAIPSVLEIVNRNQLLFEPNAELVETAYRTYRSDIILNHDAHAQQENEEVNEFMNNLPNDEDDEFDFNENLSENDLPPAVAQANSVSDEDLHLMIESLNEKQREIFDIVYNWAKKYVQNKNSDKFASLQPLQIFLTAAGGCGKSYLVKCLYNVLHKLLSRKGDTSKAKIMLLAPTGVAAVNIDGTTIHTGLGIHGNNINNDIPLSDRQRTNLRIKLEEISVIFIDEISMVGSKLLLKIHQRLCEIFGVSDRIPFANKTVIVSGDLYQLPPVRAKPVFSLDGFVISLLQLWHKFKFAELTEVMRQQGDTLFVDLLNNIRIKKLTPEDEELIKSRFISTEHPDYPWDALHIFAENSLVNTHNQRMIDNVNSQSLNIFAVDEYPEGLSQSNIERIREKKSCDTGGLLFNLFLKVGVRVMLTSNIDINDRLINGQIGTVKSFTIIQGKVETIYVLFDDCKCGNLRKRDNRFNRENGYVPIERTEAKFSVSMRKSSVTVTRTQFPLILSYACTVHKVQGLTLEKVVVSFQLNRQRSFNPGQMYVAFSRVTSLDGLFLTGNYSINAFKASDESNKEYERLRKPENIIRPIKSFSQTNSNLIITLLNIRSLRKNLNSIKHCKECFQSDLLLLTETQLPRNFNCYDLEQSLYPFHTVFNNDDNFYKSLMIGFQNTLSDFNSNDCSGFSLVSFKKNSFSSKVFTVLLLYRSHQETFDRFYNRLCAILVDNNDIDIIMGDFNVNLFNDTNEKRCLESSLYDFEQIVQHATHIDGGLIDHIYVKKRLLRKFSHEVSSLSVYFSDHDNLKINIKHK